MQSGLARFSLAHQAPDRDLNFYSNNSMEKLENPSRRGLFRGEVKTKKALRLPWIISESDFIDKCTQCHKCIDVCETEIISRDRQGYPIIDFEKGECTFCTKCKEVCDQPLFFHRQSNDECLFKPWILDLSITSTCLAKNNVVCQSCMDVCEPAAITFSYERDGEVCSIPQPQLTIDDCTQCGACITSCPQSAIVMKVN